MTDRTLRCLLVEDNLGDARLLREMLREAPPGAVALSHASRMSEAEALLRAGALDVVLLDLGLPDSQDVESIQRVRAAAPTVPVVLLTGLDDELLGMRAAKEGASDYLVKGQVDGRGLVRTLRYAVERRQVEEQRDRLQAQLLHSQKMEVVGRVAGGVAHDLNNILSVVLSTSTLAAEGLAPEDPLRRDLEDIHAAGARAASLTRKLLLFSRRDPAQPCHVDLAVALAETEKLLRRLLGEEIAIATTCEPGLGAVFIDPGHLEQILVNLAVNARDAMPGGGRLAVEARAARLGEAGARAEGLAEGEYLALQVADTGCGMSDEVCRHVFEPFFTTKEAGRGTGLGLSTVHGIVHAAGGTIRFESRPGHGTRFTVLLPRSNGHAPAPAASPAPAPRGQGRVLLVEDDDGLRRVARRVLEAGGYEVAEARSAEEAFALAAAPERAFLVLVTDLVLPHLDGRRVAERLRQGDPALRAVFMSGYSTADVERRGLLAPGTPLVHKPFSPDDLLRAVAQALDHPPAA